MINIRKNISIILFAAIGFVWLFNACSKNVITGEDPYAEGKAPLGVYFEHLNRPIPAAKPGDIVQVSLRGTKQYEKEMELFLNEQLCVLQKVTDSTVSFIVPNQVATGGIKVKIREEIYFGPKVPIDGNVYLDPAFYTANGFNGPINQLLSDRANPGNFIAVGNYKIFVNRGFDPSDYDDVILGGIQRITTEGIASTVPLVQGIGAVGTINSIVQRADNKFYVAGQIPKYNKDQVGNLARLNADGSLDTLRVAVLNDNLARPYDSFDTVSNFNASLEGGIIQKLFLTDREDVIAVGNFTQYSNIDYTQSTKTILSKKQTLVRNIAKIGVDGKLDLNYNSNNTGANGTVGSSVLLPSGKLVVVGNFTSYNGQSRNRIFALNADGTLDQGFQTGSGANDEIYSIFYNSRLKKMVIAGRFTTFNGKPANGVVVLQENGQTDEQFKFGTTDDRRPNYAMLMNNSKVVVFGDFENYNNVRRSNLLILESNGEAKQHFNNMGPIVGRVTNINEGVTAAGYPCLYISGMINSVDGKNVFNIFKLIVKN